MRTMQALVADSVGEPAEVLHLEQRAVPEPGRGQVRVCVQATPVHTSDLHILRGRYGFAPELPAVLGLESVGIVDALGEDVDTFAVGQRVITVGVTGTCPRSTGVVGEEPARRDDERSQCSRHRRARRRASRASPPARRAPCHSGR
ncbi:MAG TPA: alcohol dehydrogenase catalytic domain-containing protein [Actinomycetes bacterium]|nr:alcohol dehydrogenase catalytic domain-containing protein [Actinomycetes bacterium]